MRRTLQEQIAANKRGSLLFAFLLIVLLAALGTAITGAYEPRAWYAGTIGAALLGIIGSLVAMKSGSSIVLSMSHAREATPQEHQVLRNVTEEMAIAAGLPMPKVMVIDDAAPNAFATGPDPEHAVVAVTTGLLQKLNRDELQGVVAHELSHVRNYDIRFMTVIAIIAGFIPMLADFFMRSLWWGGGPRRRSRDSEGNQLQAIFMIVALVLAILAPIFALLLKMAVSRKREYLADASAAEMTRYPEGLASALRKIASDPDPLDAANRATQHMYIVNPLRKLGDTAGNLFSTHPPTEDRIRALMGIAGNKLQGIEAIGG